MFFCLPSEALPTAGEEAKALYKQGADYYKRYVDLHGADGASAELTKACDRFAQSLRLQFDVKAIEGLGNCRSAQRNYGQGVVELSVAINKARKTSPPAAIVEARKTLTALKEKRARAPLAAGPGSAPEACGGGGGAAQVIINEIGANETGGDTAGEFIELVNVGAAPADLGGFTLADSTSARHTFPAGTTLEAGKAIVVFGSASGIPAGSSNAIAASSGSLSLGNDGDSVALADPTGAVRDSFAYPPSLAAADG
ncbi:MAG TPA: lamin tail domain-containing protein, partial [Polyangiaceae bacterium]|nr:lamin tail domain-containing protein [Polyangiaceae bacterium]